jgi:hypothetical protein
MPTRVSKRQAAKGPVKVKQSTINAIKKTGMSKALGNITPAQRKNAAYMMGLKRMYGATRVNKALGYKAGAGSSIPVGGVMGTKRAQVMAGPVRSTMKKTTAKKTTAATTRSQAVAAGPKAMAAYNAKPKTRKKTTSKKQEVKYSPKAFNVNTTRNR